MFDPNRICLGCMEELKNGDAVCPKCGWNNAVNNNVSHQLLAGSVLMGKYLVGRVLGEGGFGITYIGWDLILDRKVAIKEFYPQGIVNRELTHHSTVVSCIGKEEFIEKEKEGFIKEAKTMAKLGNIPGIVTMHDVFAQNGTVYIVMDYVEGKTLKAYVKENGNRLSAKTAISLLEPIFGALQKIHEKGLIHRDISPDNIMLRPDGTAVLLDFGAARQMSVAGERSLTVNLKHGYAPMEQYQTRGVQGPWTDVYALSATIYRLITGRVPPSAADRIIEDDLPLPSTLGSDILPRQEEALMKGLAIRTADRTLNISELWEGLSQAPAEKAPPKQPQEEPAEENKTGEPQHIPAQQQTEESHTGEELPVEHRTEQTDPPKEPSAEEQQEAEEKEQPAMDKAKGIKFLAAVLALLLLCVLIFEPSIDILDIKKEINYRKGVSSFENKEYDKAYEQLSAVKGYKDAGEYINNIGKQKQYDKALYFYEKQDFEAALVIFDDIGNYRDTNDYISLCHKELAYRYLEGAKEGNAIKELEKLEDFDLAVTFLKNTNPFYSLSTPWIWYEKYLAAEESYKDVLTDCCNNDNLNSEKVHNLKETVYHIAIGAMSRKEYEFSRCLFVMLENYSDSEEMIKNIDDVIITYIKGHRADDDYFTFRYLKLLCYSGSEWANEEWDYLYGKFVCVDGREDMTMWTLAEDGTLTVSGEGYADYVSVPQEEEAMVKNLVINEGITGIGGTGIYCIYSRKNIESIEIPSTLEYFNILGFDEDTTSKVTINIDKNNKYYTVENGKLVRIND